MSKGVLRDKFDELDYICSMIDIFRACGIPMNASLFSYWSSQDLEGFMNGEPKRPR